jgi:hypothetical protein
MLAKVANGSVRLNSNFFSDEDKLTKNKHQVSLDGKVSYPSLIKYLKPDSDIRNISGDVLYAILIDGMGYTIAEVENLRVGDLFEFVTELEDDA